MRTRTALVPLAAVVLACAGCGSSNKAASSGSAATSTAATGRQTALPVKSVSYYVNLTTVRRASCRAVPTGSGVALISIIAASNELCWTFPPLKNITAGTAARINGHLKFGYTSTPLGPYTASGCRVEPRLMLSLLEKQRHSFYLIIANPKLPGSGVRGQF